MTGLQKLRSVQLWAGHAGLRGIQYIDVVLDPLNSMSFREPFRTLLRVTRRSLGLVRRLPDRYAVLDYGELAKYSYKGKLNTSKARNLLRYNSRVSLDERMRVTETWLRDQRII